MSDEGHLDSADLYRQFAPFVAGFLLRQGVQQSDLDDVMQEVFLVVHRIGGYSPGPAKPTTFLANIAFRAATTYRRKQKTRSFVQADENQISEALDGLTNPERRAGNVQQLEMLQAVLERLDDDKRAVFVLAEIYGETVVSIAAGFGIPVDTAYSRLREARRLFRAGAQATLKSERSTVQRVQGNKV